MIDTAQMLRRVRVAVTVAAPTGHAVEFATFAHGHPDEYTDPEVALGEAVHPALVAFLRAHGFMVSASTLLRS